MADSRSAQCSTRSRTSLSPTIWAASKAGIISRVIAGTHLLETFSCGDARRFTIVVTDGAQHQNTSEIHAVGLTQESEGLQRARIFHGCDYVITLAGCVVASPSVGPLIHLRAVPERTCRQDIASRYERRLQRIREAREPCPRLAQGVGVSKRQVLRKMKCPANQSLFSEYASP